MIATTPMRATEAIAHVRAKRGIAAPNLGFRAQLVVWERQFEDAKTRAAEERRRNARSVGVFRWMRITKPMGLSKKRLDET